MNLLDGNEVLGNLLEKTKDYLEKLGGLNHVKVDELRNYGKYWNVTVWSYVLLSIYVSSMSHERLL